MIRRRTATTLLAAVAVALATSAASAKDSAPIDIFGTSSCEAGVWAIDLRLNSTLLQDLVVDVYDTIDAPDFSVDPAAGGLAPAETAGRQRKVLVASSIPLTFQNPVIVRFHPAPDKKRDTVVVVPTGASFEERLVDTQVDSTCPTAGSRTP